MIEGRVRRGAPAEVRLRRRIGPEHPLLGPALQAWSQVPAWRRPAFERDLSRWSSFLRDAGLPPLEVRDSDVEFYLARYARAPRTKVRSSLRALYRAAFDLGLIAEMPVPPRAEINDRRRAHRLSNPDVVSLVRSLELECATPSRALRARRDLALIAIACAVDCTVGELRALRWGDLDIGREAGTLAFMHGTRLQRVALPTEVCTRIGDFRAELARWGVDVVAEDALLPALGRRVEWNWTLDERSLLAPLEQSGLHLAFEVMRRPTSVGRAFESGRYFSHRWLRRIPCDVSSVLAVAPPSEVPRIPMRRTPAPSDPEGPRVAA
jgi:hypothetical protein